MSTVTFELTDHDKLWGRKFSGDGFTVTIHQKVFTVKKKKGTNSEGRNVYLLDPDDAAWIRAAWGKEGEQRQLVREMFYQNPCCRDCGEPILIGTQPVACCEVHHMEGHIMAYLHGNPADCNPYVESAAQRAERVEQQRQERQAKAEQRKKEMEEYEAREAKRQLEWKAKRLADVQRCEELLREQLKDGPKLNQALYKQVRKLPDIGRSNAATDLLREAAQRLGVVIQPKAGGRTNEKVWSLEGEGWI